MANAITYLGNVGKSIAYSAVDEIKNLNPAITSFKDTNSDVAKSAYSSIKNLKAMTKQLSAKVMESDYADLGKDLLENMKEDIKSGKFYNKQRQDEAEQKAANAFLDISEFDIDDGTGGFDDNFESDDDSDSNIIDSVGEKTSKALANIMVGTSEYTVAAMHSDNKAAYDQNRAIYLAMHSGMKTINENIGGIVEFMSGPMQTHLENSKLYYENVTKLQTEQTEILKEIRDLYKNRVQPEKSKTGSKKITMFDITDSEGMPDLETYFNAIKQNVHDMTSGTLDMATTMLNKDTLGAMIASPLKTITDTLVKTVIPKTLKGAMKDLNASLSGVFTTTMANLNNVDEIDHPILGFLKNIFGVKPSEKNSFDNGKYNKEAIPFDGVTKHAIVNVIPTYLAEILEAVGGKGSRYDYESGKFISKEGAKKRKDRMEKNAIDKANMDINEYLSAYKKKLKFDSDEDKNQFDKDLEAILAKSFKDGKLFNYRAGGDAASYGLKGGKKSEINLEIIRAMFEKLPKKVQMQWANGMYDAKGDLARNISRAEESGYNIIGYATDGSMDLQGNKVASSDKTEKAATGRKAKKKATKAQKVKENAKKASDNTKATEAEKLQARAQATSDLEDVDNDDLYEFGDYGKESLTDKIMNAEKISEKAKLLYKNIDEILHKPTDLLAGMIKKADQTMYDLLFGKEKNDEVEEKGIAQVILDKLKERMDAFSKWIDKKIIEPITKKINKENFDKAARKVFDFFGGDYDNFAKNVHDKFFGNKKTGEKGKFGDFFGRVGNEVKGAGKFAANSVKNAADAVEFTSKLNEAGEAKKERNSKIDDILDNLGAGSIENAASGMKRVTKTGVVAVSEGEMIVPPDKNPNNIKSRLKKENAAKEKYLNYFGDAFNIENYGAGGVAGLVHDEVTKDIETFAQDMLSGKKTTADYKALNPDMRRYVDAEISKKFAKDMVSGNKTAADYKSLPSNIRKLVDTEMANLKGPKQEKFKPGTIARKLVTGKQTTDDLKDLDDDQRAKVGESLKKLKQDYNTNDYEEGREKSIIGKSIDEVLNALSSTAKEIKRFTTDKDGKEVDPKKENNSVEKMLSDQVKNFLPEMTGGALLGTGISLATGLVGGPLLGAAVGAATSLVKHSDKVQDMLFGKKVTDKDGNTSREGSKLISKDLANNIEKYLPGMAKGATVGSILSIMPFVPGGPVAGMILGAGAGFALKSEKVHEAIFGEGKMLEGFDKKVKDALPKMGAGALVGLLAGPFSLVPNLILGSAVGFATSTDKFKDLFFGKEGKDGKREGGLIKKITETAIKPVIDFGKSQISKLGEWAEKNIKEPLARAVDPLKKQVQLMFKSITDHIKSASDKFFEKHLGAPLDKWIKQKLFGGLAKIGKKLFGGAGKLVGGIISAPFRAIGGIGDNLRSKQVNNGNADYMSAEQRLMFRESKKFNRKGKLRKNEDTVKMDQYMKDMSSDQASQLADKLKGFSKADKEIDTDTDDAYNNFNDKVRHNNKISVKDTNKIAKTIKDTVKKGKGTPKQIAGEVARVVAQIPNITEPEKKEIMQAANELIASSVDARDRKNNVANDKKNALKELADEMGVSGLDDKDMEKLIKNLEAESKYKKAREDEVANGEEGDASKAVSDLPELNEQQQERHTQLIEKLDQIYQAIAPELNPNQDKIDKITKQSEDVQNDVLPEASEEANKKQSKKEQKKAEKARRKQLKNEYKQHEAEKTDYTDVTAAKEAREKYGEPDNRSFFTKAVDKIVSAFKSGSNGDLDSSDDKTITQLSPFGGVVRLRKNKDGELAEDVSDSDTKETMKNQSIINKAIAGIPLLGTAMTGMSGLFSSMHDKLFGNKEDGKEGFFSKLVGEDGILSGLFSFFTGGKIGSPIKTILSKVSLGSVMSNVVGPALLIAAFSGKFDELFQKLSGNKILKGDDTQNTLQDNRSTMINGKQLAVDENGDYIKNENGEFQTTDGEYVSGDMKTLGTDTRISTQLKKNLITGTIMGTGSVASKIAGSTKVGKAAAKTAKKLFESASKNTLVSGILNNLSSILDKIPRILEHIPFLPKSVKEGSSTIVATIMKKLGEVLPNLGKKLSSFATKVANLAPVIQVFYVAAKGIDAWGNAESILGITQNATFGQKVIATLVGVVNAAIPFIGDLIPNNVLVNIFMEIAPKLGIDVTTLEQERKEAQAEVDEYNKENGTDLSVEEYNQMNGKAGIFTKAKNGIKSTITNIKEKGLKQTLADSKPGQYIQDKVNTFKEGLEQGGLGEAVASTLDSILPGPLGDIAGNAVRIKDMAFKGDVEGVIKAQLIPTEDGEKVNMMTKLVNTILGTIIKVPNMPLAVMSKGIHIVVDGVKAVFAKVKNTFDNVVQGVKDTNEMIHDPDSTIKDFFDLSKYEDEDGNPIKGFGKIPVMVARIATVGILLVGKMASKVGNKIKEIAGVVKNNVKGVFENQVNVAKKALSGDITGMWQYSVQDNEDSPVNGFTKATLVVEKLVYTPVALVSKAAIGIGKGIAKIANTVMDNVKGVAENYATIAKFSAQGDLDSVWSYSVQDNEDSPVNGFMKATLFIQKLMATPATLIFKVGHSIASWFSTKVDAIKSDQENVSTAGTDLKKLASDGKVGSILKYKEPTLSDDDILAPFIRIELGIQKIFYTIIGAVNKIFSPIKKLIDGFKDKAGEVAGEVSDTSVKIGDIMWQAIKGFITGSGSAIADKATNYVASGSNDGTFISQLDSKYANKKFNVSGDTSTQTLGDTGCGPASAAMVINAAKANSKKITMEQAASDAKKYKMQNSGVSADYFANEFKKNGLHSQYITDKDSKTRNNSIVQHLRDGHQVVLMGQDASNTSKKNSPYGPNSHYIVANKISDNGKYIWVNDPESNKPNVRYDASKILNSTQMGVAGYVASGSKPSLIQRLRSRFVGRGVTLVGSCTNEQIYNFFIDYGFSAEAAAAAVGNLCCEAGTDNSGNVKVNSTESNGEGVGICQWSYERKTAFKQFAEQNGDPWPGTSLGTQLAYLVTELGGSQWLWPSSFGYDSKYNISYADFTKSTDIETATGAWCAKFERCEYVNSHLDRRIAKAIEVYNSYSGKHIATPDNIDTTSGTSSTTSDSESSGNVITDALSALNIFDKLAKAWGLSSDDDTSSDTTDTSSTSSATTGGTEQQNALVDKMKSVEGKLSYSQDGPRDPDQGSADCSSTVEWAYKNVLGVDPGNWTGAMATDSDLYTVSTSLKPSEFQPGDILLYNNDEGKIGHVEMYAGDNQTIGHGGGKNGTVPGPTIKPDINNYRKGQFAMARRWVGFKDAAASGSGLNPDNMIGPKTVLNYKPKTASGSGISPSKFVAAGSGLATQVDTNTQLTRDIKISTTTTKPSNDSDNSSKYLTTMITLLNAISSNTSDISKIVSILTKLAEIEAKASEIDTSTEAGKRQSKELNSSRKLLLASLKNTGGSTPDDKSLDELIKNVDAIIKA